VVLPGTELAGAAVVAESLRRRIEELHLSHPSSPIEQWVTISVGVATAEPRSGHMPRDLVGAADRALYLAKQAGRNCVRLPQEGEVQLV
jgi:two-component system chemotaxis family response regulator WspR